MVTPVRKTGRRYDALGAVLLDQAETERKDGFVLERGTLARPGIYLYRRADGSVYRELVLPEILQNQRYLASFVGMPLTVSHNEGPTPHYTRQELYDRLAGATGMTWWDGEAGASGEQHGQVMIWTERGADALRRGLTWLSPAYASVAEFYEEPQFHPDWGWYDALQIERGDVNHTTLCSDPRGGPTMTLHADADASSAIMIDRADSNQTSQAYPPSLQSHMRQTQRASRRVQRRGDAIDPELAERLDAHEEMMMSMKSALDAIATAMGELTAGGSGGGDQEQGDMSGGSGAPPEDKGDSERARVAWYNEREELRDKADAMGVELNPQATNAQWRRAIVQAAHPNLRADAADATITDLYQSLDPAKIDAPTAPTQGSSRTQVGQGLLQQARRRADSMSGGAQGAISMAEIQRASAARQSS